MFTRVSAAAAGLGCALLGMASCSHAAVVSQSLRESEVEVRRTTDGIPHIRAANWRGLGYGYGYVQAQDALCTLAEAFVTYEGRRSYYFGKDERPAHDSTFDRPKNLDLDFFFRAFVDAPIVEEMRRRQPDGLNELIVGFAAGYNGYLRELRKPASGSHRHHCEHEPWVREISADDIYRRAYAAGLAAGYARFVTQLVNAQPPSGAAAAQSLAPSMLRHAVGAMPGVGSNAMAFGADATRDGISVLFGNPHWYWGGPDRLYQAHLTIPGIVNVAGASFLGLPVIMIGFNEHVAWSHTVSAARRFGLFELQLDPRSLTAYWVDGKREELRQIPISIPIDAANEVRRTLYQSRFGPIIDLGGFAPVFGWGSQRALALRDINATNFRVFALFFRWNQARSLDELIAIQREEGSIPWVNTIAIGRNDRRVWYADIGAVPNVSDELRKACSAPLSEPFATVDPAAPVLDGSRSKCEWTVDTAAPYPGAMPVAHQPSLLSTRHIANMNNSYWLSDPSQPLEGYPIVLGGERKPLELRARFGFALAASLQGNGQQTSKALSRRLRNETLHAAAYSAVLFKKELLSEACKHEAVAGISIDQACGALRRWSNAGNSADRGSLLWDEFWRRVALIPPTELYRVAFSPDEPLTTPSSIVASDPRIAQALAAAVRALSERSIPLDAPRGRYLYAEAGGYRVPLFGGCEDIGYFPMACNSDGQYPVTDSSVGNSYLQAVRFARTGVEAFTLLAHGEHEVTRLSPLLRYARKDWLRFPFREAEITQDPRLTRQVLGSGTDR